MAANRPIDIQFSRADLHRRGARDRLRNPPVVDDTFDSLLARLQSREGELRRDQAARRIPIFLNRAQHRTEKKRKA